MAEPPTSQGQTKLGVEIQYWFQKSELRAKETGTGGWRGGLLRGGRGAEKTGERGKNGVAI